MLLALARAALDRLGLERFVLVVSDPATKVATTPAETRFELTPGLRGRARGNGGARCSRAHRGLVEARKPENAVFIVGSDELVGFSGWKRPERVLELVRPAVATRPLASPTSEFERRAPFFQHPTGPSSSRCARFRVLLEDS